MTSTIKSVHLQLNRQFGRPMLRLIQQLHDGSFERMQEVSEDQRDSLTEEAKALALKAGLDGFYDENGNWEWVKLSSNAQRAVEKYGQDVCAKAFDMNEREGEGASTIGIYLGLTTNQADAAINAGREMATGRVP